jgi:hypothetical protein
MLRLSTVFREKATKRAESWRKNERDKFRFHIILKVEGADAQLMKILGHRPDPNFGVGLAKTAL